MRRRGYAVACTLSLLVAGAAVAGEANAVATTPAPTLAISQGPTSIGLGESTITEGRLVDPNTISVYAGQTIQLWSRPVSGGSFAEIGSAVTDNEGGVSFTDTPNVDTIFELRHPASAQVGTLASVDETVNVGPTTTPGAPTSQLIYPGDQSLLMTWQPPASDGGDPITGYEVTADGKTHDLGASASSFELSGLTDGQHYLVTVQARNDLGLGTAVQGGVTPSPGLVLPPAGNTCGALPTGTTTWTAAGSPYIICPSGLTVGPGSILDIDAGSGPVTVKGYYYPLQVGGELITTGTSPTNTVIVSASAPNWIWGSGVGGAGYPGGCTAEPTTYSASAIDVRYVAAHNASIGAAYGAFAQIRDSSVDTTATPIVPGATAVIGIAATPTRLSGLTLSKTYLTVSCSPLDLTSSTIDKAYAAGVSLDHLVDPHVAGVDITNTTGPSDGAFVTKSVTATWGPGGDINGITGHGNAVDGSVIDGTVVGGVPWVNVSNSTVDHQLGYEFRQATLLSGSLTLPSNATVRVVEGGGLTFGADASLVATGGGTTITGADDPTAPGPSCTDPGDGASPPPTCTVIGYEWNGLDFAGSGDTATLTGVSIRRAYSGLTLPDSTHSATLNDVGISGCYTAISSSGANVVAAGLDVTDCTAGYDGTGPLSLTGSSLSGPAPGAIRGSGDGVSWDGSDGSPIDLRNDTFTGFGEDLGIQHTTHPTVHDVALNNSTNGPAGDLEHVAASFGAGGDISGLTGFGNVANGIDLAGVTLTSNSTWIAPQAATSAAPLGFFLTQPADSGTDLVVPTGVRLTFPAGSLVKSQTEALGTAIELDGGSIDATAGGTIFTSLNDPQYMPSLCLGKCMRPGGLYHLLGGTGGPPGISIDKALFVDSDVAVSGGAVTVTNSTIDDSALAVGNADSVVIDHNLGAAAEVVVTRSAHVEINHNNLLADPTRQVQPGSQIEVSNAPSPMPNPVPMPSDTAPIDDVSVHGDNVVTDGSAWPPVVLQDLVTTIGPTGHIGGLTGAGTGSYGVYLDHDVIASNMTWLTSTTQTGPHVLGYYGNEVDLVGDHTVVVPANANVNVSQLNLDGASLDARAGGAYIAGLTAPNQAWDYGCIRPIKISIYCDQPTTIAVNPNPTDPTEVGGVAMYDGDLVGAITTNGSHAGPNSKIGTDIKRSILDSGAIEATNGSLDLEGSELVRGAGVVLSGARSTGLIVDDAADPDHGYGAGWGTFDIAGGASATLRNDTVLDSGEYGFAVEDTANATLSCLITFGDSYGGVYVTPGQGSQLISDSVIDGSSTKSTNGSPTYDLADGRQVTTRDVWWGQPGGPIAGQVQTPSNLTDVAPASSPPPCAGAMSSQFAGTPSAPRGVQAKIAPKRITLTWAAPAVIGAAAVTGYSIRIGSRTVKVSALKCTIEKLKPGHRYTATVTGVNSYGPGDPTTITVRTPRAG